MNLVKMLEDMLSGDVLETISAKIGADPDSTERAASAAVPTLMASLAKLASDTDGARRLSNVLGSVDTKAFGNIGQALAGESGGLLSKGMGMLGSLFGDGMLNNIVSAIGRYAGMDPAIVQKLLGFITPMMLGKVASQWKSQGGTPAALSSLLSDQARHVTDAMPPGFSLDQVPGLTAAADNVRAASQTTRRAAETAGRAAPSIASWLLPIAGAVVVAFLLWQFFKSRPEEGPNVAQTESRNGETVTAMKPALPDVDIPDMSAATEELSGTFRSLTESFANIKDATSAGQELPKLEQLSAKIDSMKAALARLPESGRSTLQSTINESIGPLKEQAQKTLSLPGLSERVKQLITQIMSKLEEWQLIKPAG
jgi:uncharacterized protein DUF937